MYLRVKINNRKAIKVPGTKKMYLNIFEISEINGSCLQLKNNLDLIKPLSKFLSFYGFDQGFPEQIVSSRESPLYQVSD